MKYGPVWELRRTGCAVVVVSVAGDLVAFGNAVPPPCVSTAAASELWTLAVVLSATVTPPPMFIDCMSLLTVAACGSAKVMGPHRPLAHLWSRIATLLDDDVAVLTSGGFLTWIPAHGSAATIAHARR